MTSPQHLNMVLLCSVSGGRTLRLYLDRLERCLDQRDLLLVPDFESFLLCRKAKES